ncbi:hypothetical protein [Bacillus sp. AFS088145]|uniref:hypothetical protein n=1 Tax=Bacillus sp. AFS088145 TaxID=2033514 RepID=UPI0015CF4328|nr:hypothetical protein [Bacillus sp. AFS088145]
MKRNGLEHFYETGSIVPKPVDLVEIPEVGVTIHAVESVDGIDGEEYLHTM